MSTLTVCLLVIGGFTALAFLLWFIFLPPSEDLDESDFWDDDEEPVVVEPEDEEDYVSPVVITAAVLPVVAAIVVNDKFTIDENGRAGSPMPLAEPTETNVSETDISDESTSGTEKEEE